MNLAIDAQSLSKTYPARRGAPMVPALDSLDLAVPTGSVHGLLGHNGAGKSTTVSILTTLIRPTGGTALVAGHDVATSGAAVRRSIGVVGQQASVDDLLTGRANLVLFARLLGLDRSAAHRRADELLATFELVDAAERRVSTWSGGMRRRLDLATSLITRPEVLFVDEPTTGLDPVGRRQVWRAIAELAADGMTVLLTTQYLEEADTLAERITILRDGAVAAAGTPTDLKAALGGHTIEITVADADTRQGVLSLLPHATTDSDRTDGAIRVPVTHPARELVAIGSALSAAGIEPTGLTLREPTLDDVFLHLTEGAPA